MIRPLDPDSESEAEQISDPCEAALIGLELQSKPRALAPEGCEDRAASEPTRLLVEDLQLSDLWGRDSARLCNHHSQLCMLSCQGRKCSVFSYFNKVHGAHRGTPLCSKHLAETGRSNSPAPAHGKAKRKPEEPLLQSIRRRQSADTLPEHGPSRAVRFEEQSSPVTETRAQVVSSKELFHSIKRAGLHAKHELGLIKWPVLITNRVALSIAGLWWGGTESFRLLASDCATARVEQRHRPSIR